MIFRVFWKLCVQPFFQIIEDGVGIGLSQDKPIFGVRTLFFHATQFCRPFDGFLGNGRPLGGKHIH